MSKMRLRSLPCLVPSLLAKFSLFLTLATLTNSGYSAENDAMMSDPMIRSGESDTAMLLDATDQVGGPGVSVGPGMGLRGRLGDLLVAMEATDNRLGFGVSENLALVVNLRVRWVLTLVIILYVVSAIFLVIATNGPASWMN
jgi:hypothetical protein